MIPYSTDAPLYHWPVATAALILLTAVLYFGVPSSRLQLHSPAAAGGPAALPRMVPPEQQPANQAAADVDWGADAFSIVEDPPLAAADSDVEAAARPGGAVAANAPRPPARVADGGPAEAAVPLTLALEHGTRLKPWQWISSLFMHAGIVQLLLNLLALWAFGLIVEGKVGAWMLLAIYVGIGCAQGALEQTLTLWAPPSVSMGANAAVLGLLGVAVVWAPRNEFDVLWGFGVRGGSIEIPVLMFGLIQLAAELIGVASGGFGLASSLLHLVGLAMGIAVGAIWLRRGWVDCEGWDLISVWHGRETSVARDEQLEAEARALVRASVGDRDSRPGTAPPGVAGAARPPSRAANAASRSTARASPAAKVTPTAKASPTARGPSTAQALPTSARRRSVKSASPAVVPAPSLGQQRLQLVQRAIAEGNPAVALKLYAKLQVAQPELQLPQAALFGLIKLVLETKDYQRAIPFLRQHIERFSEQRISLQFNLAQLLLYLQQPRKSLEVLRAMPLGELDSTHRGTWEELVQHAQHQIDEGILEVGE